MTAHDYVLQHWKDTVRTPGVDDTQSFVKLPKPFTTPTAGDYFKNFYYWDTYFTNVGLLTDGLTEQAENNLDIMAFFVEKIGYVPNADHFLNGSQPPFFTRGVYDLYEKTKDKRVISKFKDAVISELAFWDGDRTLSVGLSQYRTNRPASKLDGDYEYFVNRVGGLTETEKQIPPHKLARDFLAIGESGWDCNARFKTDTNRFATYDFAALDLNCILYDAESKISFMCAEVGDNANAERFLTKSRKRKSLIESFMKDRKTGVYYDYDYKADKLSTVLSAASLFPYAFGVSNDAAACEKIFKRLDLPHGLSTAEYRGNDLYFQWDYPNMWAPIVYAAYLALKNTGNIEHAKKLKNQYLDTVESVYNETGKLWEKYDAATGKVSTSIEYETPPMMGWTAAVYEYLYNEKI